jgi:hypothetical protein
MIRSSRFCAPARTALFCLLSGAATSFAHPDIAVTIARYTRQIDEDPYAYRERAERAWTILDHGSAEQPAGEDIDTLIKNPIWRHAGLRLRAVHLYLQDSLGAAKAQILKNLGTTADGTEQARILARIELRQKDTAAAMQAYRTGWKNYQEEADFISMLALERDRNVVPRKLLEEGLKVHPVSPGAYLAAFETYWTAGGPANLKKCYELSRKAESELWPRSMDWKVRYARVLLKMGRRKEAGKVAVAALELLDNDTLYKSEKAEAAQHRKELFAMVEAAGSPAKAQ